MLWILLGMLAVLAGIVVLVLGSMWGIVLLLGGIGLTAVYYRTMMRGRGYDPEQGTLNGLGGQGKQQSETVKVTQPVIGEQSADIWDQMTNKENNP